MRYKLSLVLSLALSLTAAASLADTAKKPPPLTGQTMALPQSERDLRYPAPTVFEFAYIDKTGKVVINGPFAMAHSFSQGVAIVNERPYRWQDGHWTAPVAGEIGDRDTLIDSKGKKVGHGRLERIEPFQDQYTIALTPDGPFNLRFVLVDRHGVTSPITKARKATSYAEGLFAVMADPGAGAIQAGFGYMDKAGKLAIPYRYTIAGPFSEGLAAVGQAQKSGVISPKTGQRPHPYSYSYIDKTGARAVSGPFQEAHAFRAGLAAVCVADKWGFIDKSGKKVVPCQYDWASDFTGPLAPVEKNKMVGFIDKSGKVSIPFKFKDAGSFAEGLAPATTDGAHWGFIDDQGVFKVEPTFKRAYPFSDGLALVYSKPRTDIGTRPEEAEYFCKTANKLREDGYLNEAVRYCDMAIKLAPESQWSKKASNLKRVALPDHVISENLIQLLKRGTVFAERKDFDQAAKLFKECLSQDPDFLQASGSLAYVLVNQQKYNEALTLLTKTLEKYPSYARGQLRLATAYEGLGKMQEAQKALDKAQSLAPDDLIVQMYNLTATPR